MSASRICVKHLPSSMSSEKPLKEFFSQYGEVTDVRLVKTKAGKSRQFGFIGFRTEVQATEVLH